MSRSKLRRRNRRIPGSRPYGCCWPILPPRPSRLCRSCCWRYRRPRVVSGAVTLLLLIGLGLGRARIAKRDTLRTVLETVSIGIAAALAGVGISVLIDHGFGG